MPQQDDQDINLQLGIARAEYIDIAVKVLGLEEKTIEQEQRKNNNKGSKIF